MASILDHLNGPQREAVTLTEGPLLILAGAGSGKTRVLTHRIAYLVGDKGVRPWSILAVTFTNKAAGEMRERVDRLVGFGSKEIWLGTFHSMCARIMRREAERLGYAPNFTIYDPDDQLSVIADVMGELNLGERETPPKAVRAHIDGAKNEVVGPQQYPQYAFGYFEEKVAAVYEAYQRRLRENNALDFGDLIMQTVVLFETHQDIVAKYQDQFRYILVDEYQDTNHAQYRLVNLLASVHRNLCVVGDDDQSIYGWRGADIKNILDFEKDYPEAKVVRLEQNYRSTKTILAAAGAVIAHNNDRKGKELWTENELGDRIVLLEGKDQWEEARLVVRAIQDELMMKGKKRKDIAILYRTNAQSRPLEDRLRDSGIAYTIVGSLKFYERKEVKDVLAYLRVLVNPTDSVSLKRIINAPKRGIGDATVAKLEAFAAGAGLSLYETFDRLSEVEGLSPRLQATITEFWQLMKRHMEHVSSQPPDTLAENLISEAAYLDALNAEKTVEAESRADNVHELFSAISEHMVRTEGEASLATFLAEVSLVTDLDRWDERADAVTLMTLHCAKGLEFPVVCITGLEEGLFPLSRSFESPQELEEERRLFYVGVTRAREKVYMSLACHRHRYNEMQPSERSRFLKEVPDEFFEESSMGGIGDILTVPDADLYGEVHARAAEDFDYMPGLQIGQWVIHPSFGRGQIVDKSGRGEQLKVTIEFSYHVRKKIMVKYANLEFG